jgi:hypothetical protein
LFITVRPTAAFGVGAQWQAAKFSGRLAWSLNLNPADDCGGGEVNLRVSG